MKEGRDFYFEGPYQVFTKEFLLTRGTCCNSGCRHCPYSYNKDKSAAASLRVVSMVPSLTETLIHCDITVVGRTRYCIHPQDKVKNIPIVGGTKDLKLSKLKALKPDFVVVDKEENTKEMAHQIPFPLASTHIKSMENLVQDLQSLANTFKNEKLLELSKRAQKLRELHSPKSQNKFFLNWWSPPTADFENIVYMIWKDPWMCVSEDTFIGNVLKSTFPDKKVWAPKQGQYPKLQLEDIPNKTLVLLSSEPYPFAKDKAKLLPQLQQPSALVDGELFSWFGIRSLRFLENYK